jgi:hypothetical protein
MNENEDHEELVFQNAHAGRLANPKNGGIIDFNLPMIEVFFIMRDGRIEQETHVNDPLTLAETVAMSLDRTRARWAVYPDGQLWALTGRGTTRHYPNREAAEMVAIHRGK